MDTTPTDTAAPPTAEAGTVDWPIAIAENGNIVYAGLVIGGLDFVQVDHDADGPRVTLDLGWCRAAGVRVRVLPDYSVERPRSGVVLER